MPLLAHIDDEDESGQEVGLPEMPAIDEVFYDYAAAGLSPCP